MNSLDFSIPEDSIDSAAGLLFHYRNWRRSNPSDDFATFTNIHSHIDEQTLIELASTDLIHMINSGHDQRAENYIRLSENFVNRSEYILDLVDAEICTRSDRGETVSEDSLKKRFPDLTDAIERMFSIHEIDLEASSYVGEPSDESDRHFGNYRLDTRLNGSEDDGFELWQATERESGKNHTLMIWDVPAGMPRASLLSAFERRKQVKHPGIADLIDFGIQEPEEGEVHRAFAVMTLITGKTLFDLLESHWIAQVPESTTIGWIGRIVEAHQAVASAFHKPLSISPRDLLIDSNQRSVLIDFRLLSPWSVKPSDSNDGDDRRSQESLRAMGLLIFAICLQEADCSELETQLIAGIEPIKITDVDPTISKELNAVYLSCVHPNAKHRYRSLEQLLDDLTRLKAGKSVKAIKIQRRWF